MGWLAADADLMRSSARKGDTLEDIPPRESQRVTARTTGAQHSFLSSGVRETASPHFIQPGHQSEAADVHAPTARNALLAEPRPEPTLNPPGAPEPKVLPSESTTAGALQP